MPFPARVVAATALLAITACETVPLTGRSQLILLPEGTEVQMGLSAYREVLSKGKVSQDPVLNTQVTRVGRRIADATGKNYQWEFKVLEDKQANAFCLPGGRSPSTRESCRSRRMMRDSPPSSATRWRTRSPGTVASA